MKTCAFGICLAIAMSLSAGAVRAAEQSRHHIDHLVIGVNNLQFDMSQLKALTGVDPVFGGVHPHLGTHHALMSLGDETYLEILAPNPEADPAYVNATGQAYLAALALPVDIAEPEAAPISIELSCPTGRVVLP